MNIKYPTFNVSQNSTDTIDINLVQNEPSFTLNVRDPSQLYSLIMCFSLKPYFTALFFKDKPFVMISSFSKIYNSSKGIKFCYLSRPKKFRNFSRLKTHA